MNRFDHHWQKLIVLARQAPVDAGTAAPYGFATRVAAQGFALPPAPWLSLGRFALRGLLVAAACSVAAVVFNFAEFSTDQSDIYATGTTDTVVELLDIS
ncbi:hypothetical protein [Opitutus sp. GAS368]|jgi:hypothetical protein|uniref:hypothetical protein n=1 Tax=Opitutus sp. GAS368 TaxID=1882749 RepID=UPI00087BB43A|nr:hypothetical protein [Opitutus sp. GAS368]SDR68976.1 hypothetical protein SAMN05444173_0423 [Opitutus sp. GAS368]